MVKIHAPKSHPRYWSNYYRDLLVDGVEKGITSLQGLTAHGRGEAFDYLLGEQTCDFAQKSIRAAAVLLLLSKKPVISVNGNVAALVPKEIITLSQILKAPIEINIFHRSKKREIKIIEHLKSFGLTEYLLPDKTILPEIESNRRMISKYGQGQADLVFVPLEDGDRTQALSKMGKKVITIDLNPLSRTSETATITIVDNITRCLPILIDEIIKLKMIKKKELTNILDQYNNRKTLKQSLTFITNRLTLLSQ